MFLQHLCILAALAFYHFAAFIAFLSILFCQHFGFSLSFNKLIAFFQTCLLLVRVDLPAPSSAPSEKIFTAGEDPFSRCLLPVCSASLSLWRRPWSAWCGAWSPTSWEPCVCRWPLLLCTTTPPCWCTLWTTCSCPTAHSLSPPTSSTSGWTTQSFSWGESVMPWRCWKVALRGL